ncbi:MAG: hypothetical protein F6K35_35280, partial [Okeania sp. SIO2H7]|nr:hypothetical protein [Okeania sp. SIO2H7]
MVVWVFAGGGEAEIRGLIPFLRKNFPGCSFIRQTPARNKPGSKPNKEVDRGITGKSLINRISKRLPQALKLRQSEVHLILVLDDLDCRDPVEQKNKILAAIAKIPEAVNLEKCVG